jgi:hypothetical protein
MKAGDIYVDGIKVGVIDLSMEERDLAFEPQLASLQVGSDAPVIPGPNVNAPIRIPRGHGPGQLGPDGPPSASPPTTKQPRHGGPTFRPGVGPGSRQRREKEKTRDHDHETPETPSSPQESQKSESTGKVGGGQAMLAKRRAWIKKELEEHPEEKELVAALISGEHPQAGPAVAESLFNRTNALNEWRAQHGKPPVSLNYMMHSGFYKNTMARIGRQYAAMRGNPNYHKQLLGNVDQALGGSNVIEMHTDQGDQGDPNYYKGGVGKQIGHERYNDWGGGPGIAGNRAWRENQQAQYEAADRGNPPASAADSDSKPPLPGGPTFRRGVGPGAQLPRPEAPAVADGPPTSPDEKLVRGALHGTSLAGVDPNLREVMAGGIAAFKQANPGYDVVATSGHRHGGGFHSSGKAIDFQIIGPQGAIPNRGWDETGMYHKLAQFSLGYQMKHRPDLTGKFTWGGAFGTQRPSGGPPDLMHFDLGGWRGHYTQNRIERLKPLYPPSAVASTAKPKAEVSIGTPTETSPKPTPPDVEK